MTVVANALTHVEQKDTEKYDNAANYTMQLHVVHVKIKPLTSTTTTLTHSHMNENVPVPLHAICSFWHSPVRSI